MRHRRENEQHREGDGRERLVAVAIDKDKFSQHALKWALDNLLNRSQTVKLVHVIQRTPPSNNHQSAGNDEELIEQQPDIHTMEVFLPFRCYCSRRYIECELVVLERQDVARALIEYVSQYGVRTLLLGAPSKTGLTRLFKPSDIPGTVLKWAPDFCNVYIVSKGKCNALRSATRPVPQILAAEPHTTHFMAVEPADIIRNSGEASTLEMDTSDSISGRPSTDSTFFAFYENFGLNMEGRNSDHHSPPSGSRHNFSSMPELPSNSLDIGITSFSSQIMEDMEDEIRRLKTELKQTIDMYHAASKESLASKQKAIELENWKMKEEKRLREAQLGEEMEKRKFKAAIEAAEAAQKIIQLEVEKRVNAEMKAMIDAEEKKKLLDTLRQSHLVLKYQSLCHILVVVFLFYFYFSVLYRNF